MTQTATNDRLRALAVSAAQDDRAAFRDFVEETTPMVYRLALSLCASQADAEEVVQETYVRVWRNIAKVRDLNAVMGWVYRICRNAATDRHRAARRRPTRSLDIPAGDDGMAPLIDFIAHDKPSPEEELASAQSQRVVRELLKQLRPKHREVLLLRDVQGYSSEEAADMLGCPVGTVESRLHRARAQLARKLERFAQKQAKEQR